MDRKIALMAASASDGSLGIVEALMNVENDVPSLLEAMDFMSDVELNTFFLKLGHFASETAMALCGEEDNFCCDDDNLAHRKSLEDTENIEKLKKVCMILLKYIETSKASSAALYDIVQTLHDILIPLDDSIPGAPSLKVSIARICEKSWVGEGEGAENYVTQLIPYLLIVSLSPSALDADVKRLYSIRTAFLLLDFDDESIESIRSLILRCFLHPVFLRSVDGRRFLSFVFSVHEGMWWCYD